MAKDRTVDEWMREWMGRTPIGTLYLSRFAEPVYYLLKPIAWRPDPGVIAQRSLKSVEVPAGFVTDLASVPRAFWSLLRPDGRYVYPAIIHDFLYWTQDRHRSDADMILKTGMEEFSVDAATTAAIYHAVRLGGGVSWQNNIELRMRGERRILKKFPNDPRTTWSSWKRTADVFQ
jgi:hypothetical protein